VDRHVADNETDRNHKRVREIIRKAGKAPVNDWAGWYYCRDKPRNNSSGSVLVGLAMNAVSGVLPAVMSFDGFGRFAHC
jgi:hypothetical protein